MEGLTAQFKVFEENSHGTGRYLVRNLLIHCYSKMNFAPGSGPGEGALRYFRYRVCAAGQGIIFIILAPEPGIFLWKKYSEKGIPNGNFAPRQGIELRKMLRDKVKITAPQRHKPVHIRTKCHPGPLR